MSDSLGVVLMAGGLRPDVFIGFFFNTEEAKAAIDAAKQTAELKWQIYEHGSGFQYEQLAPQVGVTAVRIHVAPGRDSRLFILEF